MTRMQAAQPHKAAHAHEHAPPVHGEKGVYSGGEWLPIEDCAQLCDESPKSSCKACPRNPAQHQHHGKHDDSHVYDVVVIGAGCVGACIARELSKTVASVLVVDSADDVTQGATKGNSGIVHTGYDDKPGTLRARFCWPGNQMFPQLDKELNFGYQRNGSLVVATTTEEMAALPELLERGKINGIAGLRIVDAAELRQLEPHVHHDALGALWSPHTGTVTPYEFTIAVAENAAANGVEFRVYTRVTDIKGEKGHFSIETHSTRPPRSAAAASPDPACLCPFEFTGAMATAAAAAGAMAAGAALHLGDAHVWGLPTVVALAAAVGAAVLLLLGYLAGRKRAVASADSAGKSHKKHDKMRAQAAAAAAEEAEEAKPHVVRAKYIVNAAGLGSDKISAMVGDTSFTIKPRTGDYFLLHKNQGHLVRRVLFPTPSALGKGILIQPTLWGNVLLGPTARDHHDPVMAAMTPAEIAAEIVGKCRKLIPGFDAGMVIHSFAGDRAKSTRGDWVIEESKVTPGFIQAAGIDSPGLASSPAIAQYVVQTLLRQSGFAPAANKAFHAHRNPIIRPKHSWRDLKIGDTDPKRNVVCKCEKVTEAEIVDAIHRNLTCESTQAIRKRTRAGMGHCQGEFCEPRVTAILARELKVPEAEVATRPWPATSLLPRRWLTDEDKESFKKL